MSVGNDADFHSAGFLRLGFGFRFFIAHASFFISGDSAGAVSFAAPTKSAVNNPPLKSVLRKNSSVVGQPFDALWSTPAASQERFWRIRDYETD